MVKKNKSYVFITILAVVAGLVSNIIVRWLFNDKIDVEILRAIISGSLVLNIILLPTVLILSRRLKANGLNNMP
jgi:H+/Cl- antiporter ClcA